MSYMDFVSLASLVLAALSFFGSSFKQLAVHKKKFEIVGWFFLGFVASRIAYALLPGGSPGAVPNYQVLVWGVVIAVGVIIVLTALKQHGPQGAMWMVMLLFAYLTIYGKGLGLVGGQPLHDDETLIVVDSKEHSGDFDRALDLLTSMESGRSKEENDAIQKRIDEIKAKKLQKISTQQ